MIWAGHGATNAQNRVKLIINWFLVSVLIACLGGTTAFWCYLSQTLFSNCIRVPYTGRFDQLYLQSMLSISAQESATSWLSRPPNLHSNKSLMLLRRMYSAVCSQSWLFIEKLTHNKNLIRSTYLHRLWCVPSIIVRCTTEINCQENTYILEQPMSWLSHWLRSTSMFLRNS